jgi:hypothetical protein
MIYICDSVAKHTTDWTSRVKIRKDILTNIRNTDMLTPKAHMLIKVERVVKRDIILCQWNK